ncbi:MAG: DinB family protein [Anaerolineae bacterium]|nr:DinB family protein [Anaerolineae bacterium]
MVEQFLVDYLERLQDLHQDFIEAFEGLPGDALDWRPGADRNSLCVLVVHTTGASHYWIGAALGETPERDRAAEFRAQGLNEAQLKARFATLEAYARGALARITLANLALIRSIPNRDMQVSAGWALLHALEHTGLHLGHAQITRQLWDQR